MPTSTRALPAALLCCAALTSPSAAESPQWTRIGPYSGDVSAFAAAQPDLIYVSTFNGSVFRSVDHARTWTFAGAPGGEIYDLAVDPKAPSTVYAGTTQGLSKSLDRGATWERVFPLSASPAPVLVSLVAVDPKTPRIVWAAVAAGELWKSRDGGQTWTAQSGDPRRLSALAIDPVRPATLYASTLAGGVFKTVDSGKTWSRIERGLPRPLTAASIAVDPSDRQTLLLASLFAAGEVFKSTDGGANWKLSRAGLAGRFVVELAFDPSRSGAVYAATTEEGVFASSNGGRSWQPANAGLAGVELATLLATRAGLLAGGDRGVFASADRARTWRPASDGLAALHVSGLAIAAQDPPRLYAGSFGGGLFKSANRGASWLRLNTEVPLDFFNFQGPVAIDPHDPLTVYALYTRGFARSTNGGRRWTATDLGCLGPARLVLDATTPTTVFANGFFVIAACGLQPNACSSVRVSADGERTCVRHEPIGRTGVPVLAADPHAPGTVFAVGPEGLYRSPDRGVTWALLAPGIGPGLLAFDPEAPGVVYGTFPGAVGRSPDGGATWDLVEEGLPAGAPVVSLAFDPDLPSTLYAATHDGVYKSIDSGAGWDFLAAAPDGIDLFEVVVDPVDPTILYAATGSASVLRLDP